MAVDGGVHQVEDARGQLALRTPVIAGNLYMNGWGYQGLCADRTSWAFEVSRDRAGNVPSLNMASDDLAPAGTPV
jgi:hypothetical protein